MSRLGARRRDLLRSFPRVSGDEPAPGPTSYAGNMFSPRERG